MTTIQFLAEWGFRSSALILSGALLLWALRVKDSSVRLAAWTAILCGSVSMPLLTAALPPAPWIRLAVPSVIGLQSGAPWTIDAGAPELDGARSHERAHIAAHRAGVSTSYDWPHFALTVYFAVTGFFLLRLCAGLVMSARLLRASRAAGQTAGSVEILESDDVSAPLSLGIVRPAILLPGDWRNWDGEKLAAVLAHERSHILRRDPAVQLLSAIHRALSWPNPLSWYLHRAIVRAAEESSDDAAVAAINDRASYAAMLLEFIERSARDANWQGVAMARYARPEERIHRILDGTALSRGVTRWAIAAILALGSPLAFIAAAAHLQPGQPPRLTFQSAAVRPAPPGSIPGPVRALRGGDGYTAQDATVRLLIGLMYKAPTRQILGGPAWIGAEGFDIEAKADRPHDLNDLHVMFRNLLTDRFKLKYHTEIKQGPVYTLTVDAGGVRMKVNESPQRFDYPVTVEKDWTITGNRVPMEYFCWWLGQTLQREGRPVIDKTGLDKNYDFKLAFAPELPPGYPRDKLPAGSLDRPSVLDAVTTQLGLKLQAEEGPVEYFVIDHIEKPTAN